MTMKQLTKLLRSTELSDSELQLLIEILVRKEEQSSWQRVLTSVTLVDLAGG